MLKSARVGLGVLTVTDTIFFCERAKRGGINEIGALKLIEACKKLWRLSIALNLFCGVFLYVAFLFAGTMQQFLPIGTRNGEQT